MAYDGIAVDKRRIQDTEGNIVDVTSEGLLPVVDSKNYNALKSRRNYVETVISVTSLNYGCLTIDMGSNDVINFRLEYFVSADNDITVTLLEDPAVTGGSSLTPRNLNRNSSAVNNGITFKSGATLAGGITLQTLYLSKYPRRIESDSRNSVWILRPRVKYAIKVYNPNASTVNVVIAIVYNMS